MEARTAQICKNLKNCDSVILVRNCSQRPLVENLRHELCFRKLTTALAQS